MPVVGLNAGQISQAASDALTAADAQPNADTSIGTVHRDLLDVLALQLAESYLELENARLAASLKNFDFISQEALSQIALNFDVLRSAATKATGTVTFQSATAPTSNIGIPKGTIVRTPPLLDGTVITYTTDADATLATTATLNPLNGFYEVDVAVTAQTAGKASHAGVNSLTELPNRIAGISTITNKQAINNASNEDDNETLATAIRAKTAGSDIATSDGYVRIIEDGFTQLVSGIAIVGPRDDDNDRAQYGNEVDVPVISLNSTSFTTILTTNGSNETRFEETRPVKTVSSVVGATNGTHYTNGTNFGFKQDMSVVYGYSAQSFDALTWFPGQALGPGVQLTVQGTYNKIVKDVQDFLDNPTRRYITGDLLVKEGQKVLVDIAAEVTANSGVSRSQLKSTIESALTTLLNGYTLGQDVLEDDIIKTIQAVSGVFFIDVPLGTLKKSTASSGSDNIDIRQQEYARPGTLTITVN